MRPQYKTGNLPTTFFCSPVFVSVCVLTAGPGEDRGLDTPGLGPTETDQAENVSTRLQNCIANTPTTRLSTPRPTRGARWLAPGIRNARWNPRSQISLIPEGCSRSDWCENQILLTLSRSRSPPKRCVTDHKVVSIQGVEKQGPKACSTAETFFCVQPGREPSCQGWKTAENRGLAVDFASCRISVPHKRTTEAEGVSDL